MFETAHHIYWYYTVLRPLHINIRPLQQYMLSCSHLTMEFGPRSHYSFIQIHLQTDHALFSFYLYANDFLFDTLPSYLALLSLTEWNPKNAVGKVEHRKESAMVCGSVVSNSVWNFYLKKTQWVRLH